MDEEEQSCPVCKSDTYLTPSMVLMVSPCYHLLCNSCVDRLFMQGQAPCPQCGAPLRKASFHVPKFSDLRVEKECRIRRQVARCLNKRQEDFAALREYNDYLEHVEEIVFQLVNDIDVEATMAKLDTYRRENAGIIDRNAKLESLEEQQAQREMEALKEAQLQREMEILAEIEEEQRSRFEADAQMIDALSSATPTPPAKTESKTGKKSGEALNSLLRKHKAPLEPAALPKKARVFDYLNDVTFSTSAESTDTASMQAFFREDILQQMQAAGFSLPWAMQTLWNIIAG